MAVDDDDFIVGDGDAAIDPGRNVGLGRETGPPACLRALSGSARSSDLSRIACTSTPLARARARTQHGLRGEAVGLDPDEGGRVADRLDNRNVAFLCRDEAYRYLGGDWTVRG